MTKQTLARKVSAMEKSPDPHTFEGKLTEKLESILLNSSETKKERVNTQYDSPIPQQESRREFNKSKQGSSKADYDLLRSRDKSDIGVKDIRGSLLASSKSIAQFSIVGP